MKNKVIIYGGGTYNPVFNHFGLTSYAGGGTARRLHNLFLGASKFNVTFKLSRQGVTGITSGPPDFVTNADLQALVDKDKNDPEVKVMIMTAAVCDFEVEDGSDTYERPNTDEELVLRLKPSNKIVRSIRDKDHKHIFLVAFKQTCNISPKEMYLAGLKLCKQASCNLVFVNDTVTRHNMIVTPEEAVYADGWERNKALRELVEMTILRSHLSFTRSTVISGKPIPWSSQDVPESLRTVVNYCIENKAYKEFNGATVGHFAVKVNDNTFLTSIRRSNFNDLEKVGLVKVVTDGPDEVYAYGAKPSVGGQSQRLVFSQHQGMDCIVHMHCPLREDAPDAIETRSQRDVECGSHECGKNTSDGLKKFGNLKAVYLHKHGPNIVFNRDIDPQEVIKFIDRNFDLSQKTGGYNLT